MEVRRALADLAEVRGRMATVQRFDGYSGNAAIASGGVALVAGAVQWYLSPFPATLRDDVRYLAIWLTCLGFALAINYGAILVWRTRNHNAFADIQMRNVGMSIFPAVAAGGVITGALVARELYDLLPGMWCAIYALGLFASRSQVPREVVGVAIAFGAAACVLLFLHGAALAWWIMPLAFGGGQITIGSLVRSELGREQRGLR
jgi:hypothetical protein